VVVALTLLGSLILSAPSSNSTICFVIVATILTIGRYLNVVALAQPEPFRSIIYTFYFAVPHLEIPFEMRNLIVHDWPLIGWNFVALDTLYLLAYAAAFLLAACLVFRRKPVN
jgi:hypothetical protein